MTLLGMYVDCGVFDMAAEAIGHRALLMLAGGRLDISLRFKFKTVQEVAREPKGMGQPQLSCLRHTHARDELG